MRLRTFAAKRLGILITTLFISGCSQNTGQACFPKIDTQTLQYIVGHGQLLYDARLRNTSEPPSTSVLPIMVNNYKRSWIARDKADGAQTTHLGVVPEIGKHFNGILVASSPSLIKKMDRHSPHCCRVAISRDNLSSMTNDPIPEKGKFWIYQIKQEFVKKAATNYPVQQSKVDEFLTGCIDQGEFFQLHHYAEQCIITTEDWPVHWYNDRKQPIGGRLIQSKHIAIDELLMKLKGDLYEKIKTD